MSWHEWRPYVSVAERRRRAQREMESLRETGVEIRPVKIQGRTIARTFWGKAWCDHLESFSDYENRLPRGRTYVRNGSVCHLAISKGKIEAKVSGSEIYNLRIQIKTLPDKKWKSIKRRCAGKIGSLIELLQGRLSDQVMEVVTERKSGLFPSPREISLGCDCPDWAVMCKHVAAVLYGVGARLDDKPELLFSLRGVDHEELIEADTQQAVSAATTGGKSKRLAPDDLSDVFGIDLEDGDGEPPKNGTKKKAAKKKNTANGRTKKSTAKKVLKKVTAKKKTAKKKSAKASAKKTATIRIDKQSVTKPASAKKAVGRTAKKKAVKTTGQDETKRAAKKATKEPNRTRPKARRAKKATAAGS